MGSLSENKTWRVIEIFFLHTCANFVAWITAHDSRTSASRHNEMMLHEIDIKIKTAFLCGAIDADMKSERDH